MGLFSLSRVVVLCTDAGIERLIAAAPKPATTPGLKAPPDCSNCPGCRQKRQRNRQKDTGATWAAAPIHGAEHGFGAEAKPALLHESANPRSACPPEWKFNRRFINKETGMGIVSTEFIPAGAVIYLDQLILVTERERKSHSTPSELDELLAKKVAEKDPQWQEGYMSMPNTRKELGTMGGIWDEFHLPLSCNGKPSSVLGLNLAFTNHSCLPNASLAMFLEYPVVDGVQRKDKKPILGGAVVRSFVDIPQGQEITISYFYSRGEADYRRLYSLNTLGFRCSCECCLHPDARVERALRMYDQLDHRLSNPKIVYSKPSVVFQVANEITTQLTDCGIADSRIAVVWTKCALVAGLHSDVGRVRCFLLMVIKIVEALQGTSSTHFQCAQRWFHSMSTMPGFATTTRGVSTMREANELVEHNVETKPFLFMVGATEDEYIRVNRCRRIPDKISNHGATHTMRFVVVPDAREGQISPVKVDQKQCQSVKGPQITKKKKRRSNKKKKKKEKTTTTGRKKTGEKCIDPEKDFLTLFSRVVNDFIDHGSHEPSTTTRKGKETTEDSNSMEQKNHDHNINNFTLAQETALKPGTPKKPATKPMSTIAHKQGAIRQVKAQNKAVVERVPVEMVQALQSQGLVQSGAVSVHGSIQDSSVGSSQDSSSEKS